MEPTRTAPTPAQQTSEFYFCGVTSASMVTLAATKEDTWIACVALACAAVIACWYVWARSRVKIDGEVAPHNNTPEDSP